VFGEHVEGDARLAAGRLHARAGDQGGEIPISLAGLGEKNEMTGGRELRVHRELGADDALDLRLPGGLREPDHPAQLVVVGERERGVA
jgi:hypothetical protein